MKMKWISGCIGVVLMWFAMSVVADNHVASLNGHWVDTSGRGAMEITDEQATFTSSTNADQPVIYQLDMQGEMLVLTPTVTIDSDKPIQAQVDWDEQTFSYKKGLYQFVRAPQITAEKLEGFWFEEAERMGTKHIRSIEYKENARQYDYYSWQVNPAYGTYSYQEDLNVPLQIAHGFVFTDPTASHGYVHYAVRQDGDTIHYVDRNGATWTETRTDDLYRYAVPDGFKNMQDYM